MIALVTLVAVSFNGSFAAAGVADFQAGEGSPSSSARSTCPSAQSANQTLGEASGLLQQSQFSMAADLLQPLAAARCEPAASLLLAASFEGLGDTAKAENILAGALQRWPTNNSIAASLARDYMSTKQVEEAVKALAHFKPSAATPQQEMEAATVVYLAGHRLASAEVVARLDYRAHPSVQSLLLLANTIQLEGRYKDVIALLQGKRAEYSQSAPFFVTLAESEFDANMFDDARQDLAQAVKLDASLYQAHYLLGNVFMKQGEFDAASSEYHTAMGLAPNQPRTYYQLALVLRAKQQDADEEALLLKAIEIDSHFTLAHAELGRILLNQNRLAEAVAELNLALQNNPLLEQPYNLLARAYGRLGDTEKANAMATQLSAVRATNHQKTPASGVTSH